MPCFYGMRALNIYTDTPHWFTHSLTTFSLTHSLTHSLTTHSLTHSLAHWAQVVDTCTGAGTPGAPALPVLPPLCPPATGGLPGLNPVMPGTGWAFVGGSAGHAQAYHMAGALQSLNPGLELKVFSTSSPMVDL